MKIRYKDKITTTAIIAFCFMMNNYQAAADPYNSVIEAIQDTASPRTYTLNANETTLNVLDIMRGANDAILTIDGGTGNYGIINGSSNKDARLYISKSAQTFNLKNVGSYKTTISDSIIAGKSIITDVIVGNSISDFGIVGADANHSSYTGFLRSAGKSNITNSVFYNNIGLYGAAIQNRENGTLSVKNSVFVGNSAQQGTIHNDGAQKITDISDSIFYNNTAAILVADSGNKNLASGVFNKAGKTIDLITGSTFTNNIATGDSKNIAATILNAGTIDTITDSIFYNNISENNGSVIYNDTTGTITTISDSYFVNNTAVSGILENVGSISNIINSTFNGNTVTKNGIIALYNDTAASTINIGEINNVQVTDNTGNGIYIRAGKSDSTINIGKITEESKFNNNIGSGLYIGGNSGIINIDEISNSEFNNNTQRGLYIQNNNSGVGQITIGKISDVKVNGNHDGGIFLQRNGGNTLQINEISNVEIKNNTITTSAMRGAGLRNEGAHIVNMSNVIFDNDTLDYTKSGPQGGAIYNSQYGKIDEMRDIIIQNCSAYNGGAIYNVGTIGSIVNMTVSDINTSDVMIATEENGHIGTIDNMTIQNSAGTGLSFYGATGETIQNSTFTNMYGPGAKMGYGLQVTAKPQTTGGYDSHVNLIDNITVAGNQTGGMRIDDNSSSVHTANVGLIKNSQFTNNGTTGNIKAGGIWARTDVLTISADGAGKTTTFKGNKRQGEATGIWMENKNSTLNLQQLNSGEMFMYDPIKGNSNKYYVNISGDNTGTLHLYDDIVNGMVDVQNTNISTIDGEIHNYSFSTLSSDTNSKYTLDIFFDKNEVASTIDTFTISNLSLEPETSIIKSTSGKITLHALNFLNDVDESMIGKSAELQIINAPVGSTLGLVNGFEIDPEHGYVLFTLQDDVQTEYDPVDLNTDWNDKIKIYDIATKVLGDVEIKKTYTTDDTLKITIAESTKSKTWTGNYLDTLMAVNQAELDTRNFTTDDSSAVYDVTADLGVTAARNFNIKGKDSELSLIDFNGTEHHKGFELENGTNLTLENVEIKNSSQLVSGVATDSNINIYNSYLHDNGKGIYLAGNANIEGTTQINDDFYLMGDTSALTVTGQIRGETAPADITFNKRLAGSETSTFTFSSGTVTLGNNASVASTNLVLDNTTLNVGANNAFSNVNLTSGDTILNLQNESTGTQTFNTLTLSGDMAIKIDLDLENVLSDNIVVTGTNAEDFISNGYNIIIDAIYLMNDALNDDTDIILTDDNRFEGVYTLSDTLASNITKAVEVTGSYSIDYSDFGSIVGKDNDKGILVINKAIVNSLAAQVASDDAIKLYGLSANELVKTDLGTLHGKSLAVTGNGSYIVNGQTHEGITLGAGGENQTLSIQNIPSWKNFDIAITNGVKGTLEISNVIFESNSIADIDNSGVMTLSGTNSFEIVKDSLDSGSTTITGGTTTAGTITQNAVNITGGKLVSTNGITTTNGITNSIADGLEIQGGTINSDVSGSGSTKINTTGTVYLSDGKGISQAINLAAGTFNTNAEGIQGGLAVTSGTVNLTGGTLSTAISGTLGDTKINGNVTVGSGGSIANAVTIEGTSSVLTAALSDLTGGVTVNSGNTLNLQGQIANGILGTGTVVLNEQQDITSNISFGGTLNSNGQTLNLKDSSYETITVGNLTGNSSLTLDVNAQTGTSDIINIPVGNANNSVLTITDINLTKPLVLESEVSKEYSKQILTGVTSGVNLALSEDLQTPVITAISRSGTDDLNTNAISWNANYGGWTQNGTQTETLSIVNSSGILQDTIKYTLNKEWGAKDYTSKSENLAIMNTYAGEGSNNRSVDFTGIFDSPNAGTYTVASDLGTSSGGTYTLNGVKGGAEGNTNTTIDLNNHSGFVLSNPTTLVLQNIDFLDSTNVNATLITVDNANAAINLTDTNIQGAIARTGSTEYNITASGTNSLQNVTGAKIANSGTLSLSNTNNLVNITNGNGSTTITGGTTTAGTITQNAVNITGGKLVSTNGITTTSGITNSIADGLEIQGGTINSDVSGSGSTKINTTGTVYLSDGKGISQAINLAAGTFNTNAEGIQGGLAVTSGTVNLTGGTLSTAISGTLGDTKINGNVTVGSGGSIANDVIIASGTLTSDVDKLGGNITNNSTLNLSGTLTKTIAGITGTTKVDTNLIMANGSSIAGNADVNGGHLTLNGNSGIGKTLNLSNGTVTVSDSATTNHSIGALEGIGNFELDIDYSGASIISDTITLTNDTSTPATIAITKLTEIGTRPTDFTKQILIGADTNTVINIDTIKSQFDITGDTVNKEKAVDLDTNTIKWSDNYGTEKWTETYDRTLSVTGSSVGLSDSIKYTSVKTGESEHTYNPKAENLAIMNQYNGAGFENRTVDFTGILADKTAQGIYVVKEDLGTTNSGKLTLNGEILGENKATIDFNTHKGFELDNNNTELVLKDLEIKNSSSLISGNATTGVKITLDNVDTHDNGNGIKTAGDIEIKGNSNISDNIQVTGTNSKVNIDGSDGVSLNANITGTGTSTLSITNGTINLGNNTNISGFEAILENTSLNISDETFMNGLNTTFNGTNNLNTANGNIGILSFGNLNLNGLLRMQVDADLANAQMDRLTAANAIIGPSGRIEVSKINLLSPTTQKYLDLLFTDNADLANIVNYTGEGQIVYSPIYKYNVSYSRKSDGGGYFSFATPGNSYNDFNPSVMTAPVTALVSGYQNQVQALHGGFYHMDRYMKLSDKQRFIAEHYNNFASLAPVTDSDILKIPETSKAMWVIPYSTFESVNLKGGVKVNNIAYGITCGGDTNMFEMKRGFKGVISTFLGYNGNHMTYDGITMQQNGGFLGATLNAYRGNFFTGLTLSTGASVGNAQTMYGHDNLTMLTAGVANKTGYNFEFKEGKIIVQPSLFLGYTWVNVFDYRNSAGVNIKQDALNTLQIVPGIKIIGNTKSGWQPYAGIDMVWNIFMGRNQVYANDVVLPKLSERAYVQYGIGLQKTWADKFTGFVQAMVRNGGRNGIVLSAGFRWVLGKSEKNMNGGKIPTNTTSQKTKINLSSIK